MGILAIETSGKQASVALFTGETCLGQARSDGSQTHSVTLLPLVHNLLETSSMTMGEIDAIAVARGPGSFTGLRIGLAAAKGLALALDKPVIGVSSLEAIAQQAKEYAPGHTICAVMDARRLQVYNALFTVQGGRLIRQTEDRAISIEDLFAEKQGDKPYVLVGDGAMLCYEQQKARGVEEIILPQELCIQSAFGVGIEAIGKQGEHAHSVNPEYLRKPQAEREREEKTGGMQR